MESRFNEFQTEYNLNDEAMGKLLGLFNDAFIDIAHKLISEAKIPTNTSSIITAKSKQKSSKNPPVKRWATKIAADYGLENNLTLDDFDVDNLKDGKITKNDINAYIKDNKKDAKKTPRLNTKKVYKTEEPWYKNQAQEKTVHKCCGMNKSGDPCKQPGTVNPDGAKNHYCFRHGVDWKNFEVSSDSDLEEEALDPIEGVSGIIGTIETSSHNLCEIVDSE